MLKNKKKIRNRQNKRLLASFEKLESRQLYSVVTATPQNFQSVINNSQAGDTISFTPGNYTVSPNSVTFQQGRHYIGNGASFAATSNPSNNTLVTVDGGNGTNDQTEVTGFTFTGGPLSCASGSFDIHGNTFNGPSSGTEAISIGGCTNSSFNFNTFNNMAGSGGIYGYPGSNDTFDNNAFNGVEEPIHLIGGQSNTNISGNVINGATRIAIELQDGMQNLSVTNNWIGDWGGNGGGHMAISCATGGNSNSSSALVGCGNNITISGNTLLDNGEGSTNTANHWQDACVELMGTNITFTNNVDWNYACLILNGQWGPANVKGNQIYGGTLASPDNVEPAPSGISTGDSVQPLGNYKPSSAVPTVSQTLGAAPSVGNAAPVTSVPVTTATAPSTPVTSTPAPTTPTVPAGISATASSQSGQLTVTAPVGSTLGIYASSLDPSTAVSLGATTGKLTTIDGIPLDWNVTVTVTTGGTTYTLPEVQVLQSSFASTGPFNPVVVQTVAPVVTTTTPTPVTTLTPVVTTPTVPAGITATANGQSGEVVVDAPAGSTLGIYASTLGPSAAISLGAITDTSATIGGIPLNWQITVTVTTGGTTYTLPVIQVLNSTIPSTASFNPVLVVASPARFNPSAVFTSVGFIPRRSRLPRQWLPPRRWRRLELPPRRISSRPHRALPKSISLDRQHQRSGELCSQRRATHGRSGFQTVATIAAGVSSYNDLHVNADWEYDYRLVAVLSGAASPTVAAHVQVEAVSGSTVAPVSTPACRRFCWPLRPIRRKSICRGLTTPAAPPRTFWPARPPTAPAATRSLPPCRPAPPRTRTLPSRPAGSMTTTSSR